MSRAPARAEGRRAAYRIVTGAIVRDNGRAEGRAEAGRAGRRAGWRCLQGRQ